MLFIPSSCVDTPFTKSPKQMKNSTFIFQHCNLGACQIEGLYYILCDKSIWSLSRLPGVGCRRAENWLCVYCPSSPTPKASRSWVLSGPWFCNGKCHEKSSEEFYNLKADTGPSHPSWSWGRLITWSCTRTCLCNVSRRRFHFPFWGHISYVNSCKTSLVKSHWYVGLTCTTKRPVTFIQWKSISQISFLNPKGMFYSVFNGQLFVAESYVFLQNQQRAASLAFLRPIFWGPLEFLAELPSSWTFELFSLFYIKLLFL